MLKMNIKEVAEEKGIALHQIAVRQNLRYGTVVDYANNKKESINLKYLEAILEALEMDLAEMHKLFVKVDEDGKKIDKELVGVSE